MATVPHARTPQPIIDTVEAVLAGRIGGLPPARIEILVAQRLGSALPTDLSITTVLEDLVAAGRGEWVSSTRSGWRMRLFADGESAPELPAGTRNYEALQNSPLNDTGYVNTFPYRQIDYLHDGRVIISAVSLTRNAAAMQGKNWLHDNDMVRETHIERNLGGGRWGVVDAYTTVGKDAQIRHFDVVAAQLRAQKQTQQRDRGGAAGREIA